MLKNLDQDNGVLRKGGDENLFCELFIPSCDIIIKNPMSVKRTTHISTVMI